MISAIRASIISWLKRPRDNCACVVTFNDFQTLGKIRRIVVMQTHSNTRISETHGDTATHGARTNNRGFVDLNQRCVFIKTRNLIRGTFCKEDMNQLLHVVDLSCIRQTSAALLSCPHQTIRHSQPLQHIKNLLWCKTDHGVSSRFASPHLQILLYYRDRLQSCLPDHVLCVSCCRGNNLFSKGNARFNDIAIGNTVNNA